MTGQRLAIGLLALLFSLAVAGAALCSSVLTVLFTCGGDGGAPFSARDSTTGRVCESLIEPPEPWVVAQLGLPVLVTIGLGVAAAVRLRWGLAWVGLAWGVALAIVPALVLTTLPDDCSDQDQRAYEAWVRSEGKGPMPADCETY